jgi:hypothetical protein
MDASCSFRPRPTIPFLTLAAGWVTSISRRMALPSLVRTMPGVGLSGVKT